SFGPAAASRTELAVSPAAGLGMTHEHRPAMPLKLCRDQGAPTRQVCEDKVDHSIRASLLLISNDRILTMERSRRTYTAPAHRVQVAGTIAQGLEYVRKDFPDVIILDLGLSDQPGLEIYQQIRRINANVPVIVVAGIRQADAAIEPIKQGAYDCLFKPLD